jgi:hypothetical protein
VAGTILFSISPILKFTGFAISNSDGSSEKEYVDTANITLANGEKYLWVPEKTCSKSNCSLSSIKISGEMYINKSGKTSIKIKDKEITIYQTDTELNKNTYAKTILIEKNATLVNETINESDQITYAESETINETLEEPINISFKDICEDSCKISLNEKEIYFEIGAEEGTKITLSEIKYTWKSENSIANISEEKTTNSTTNVSVNITINQSVKNKTEEIKTSNFSLKIIDNSPRETNHNLPKNWFVVRNTLDVQEDEGEWEWKPLYNGFLVLDLGTMIKPNGWKGTEGVKVASRSFEVYTNETLQVNIKAKNKFEGSCMQVSVDIFSENNLPLNTKIITISNNTEETTSEDFIIKTTQENNEAIIEATAKDKFDQPGKAVIYFTPLCASGVGYIDEITHSFIN